MNRLSIEERARIINLLVEGNSLRATSRIAGVSINTVTKLLIDVGSACADYQDKTLRSLKCRRVQCDEIWSFVYAKEKNFPADKKGEFGHGDVWTWTAIDADTKLVPSFMVGNRDGHRARLFIDDLKERLANPVHLTTDGHRAYLNAVEGALGSDIDYAVLVKIYGSTREETRYSPGEWIGCRRQAISGNPDPERIFTSFAERRNPAMRMGMRRFTCLTNAFSKKVENHAYRVALHFMYYNFGRIHKALRVTPGMEAGVSGHVWTLKEISGLAK